jgi:hypothetical protein
MKNRLIALALTLGCPPITQATINSVGVPEFVLGETIEAESNPGVRLNCSEHYTGPNPDAITPMITSNFQIEVLDPRGSWTNAGFLNTEFRTEEAQFGTHLRIAEIQVLPQFRRQRIATKAVELVLAHFDSANYHINKVEISSSNKRSIRLFRNLGFRLVTFIRPRTLLAAADVGIYVRSHGCKQCFVQVTPEDRPLLRCGRCYYSFYCSKEHQNLDWTRGGHKTCCKTETWEGYLDLPETYLDECVTQ